MRFSSVLPLVAVLALTACGSGGDEAPTAADAAEELADAPQPLPGEYRTTTEMLEFTAPGMPAEALAMIQAEMAQSNSDVTTTCLTPEQAAIGQEEMLKSMTEGDCTVQRLDVSGGTIDAAMSCPMAEGITSNVTVSGTMGESGSDLEMTMATTMPQVGDSTMRMRVVSERIGDCATG